MRNKRVFRTKDLQPRPEGFVNMTFLFISPSSNVGNNCRTNVGHVRHVGHIHCHGRTQVHSHNIHRRRSLPLITHCRRNRSRRTRWWLKSADRQEAGLRVFGGGRPVTHVSRITKRPVGPIFKILRGHCIHGIKGESLD